jgi:hypothetical protein
MSNEKHTVTISGDEYIEYIRLRTEKKEAKFIHIDNINWYIDQLKKEKENKNITVTLKRCNYSYSKSKLQETFFEVHVSSLDSLRQTKFLAKKIMELVFPLSDLNEKYKEQINVLEQNIKVRHEEIDTIPMRIHEKFKNLSWYKRLFYSYIK